MGVFTEIVLEKIWHPSFGRFMTKEEYTKARAAENPSKEIDDWFENRPNELAAKEAAKLNPVASEKKSSYAGMTLTAKVKENPRKAGTIGRNSFQLILENPGIVFEKFRELGGRVNDLKWDIEHDWVEAK